MNYQTENPFLSKIMRRIRSERPLRLSESLFYNRVEKSRGGNYVEVWFISKGCRWDADGGCTMCNYGPGHDVSDDEIIDAVYKGLSAIDVEVNELVVSPSGSMLNPGEIPLDIRRKIFTLISEFPARQFVFETRPETVTEEAVQDFVKHVPGKKLGVEMGLESSSPWIQRFCINKGSHPSVFINAAEILKKNDVVAYGNISLGTAFLTEAEAVDDAEKSARWAFDNGADIVVLFPLHVKPYTLLAWLYQQGLYRPPSLWSLVEVLDRLGPESMGKTEISWYRSYYDDESKILASPTTCIYCKEKVMKLLDQYRDSRSPEVVHQLKGVKCQCKSEWEKEINNFPKETIPERVSGFYEKLAYHFLCEDWWTQSGSEFKNELFEYNDIDL